MEPSFCWVLFRLPVKVSLTVGVGKFTCPPPDGIATPSSSALSASSACCGTTPLPHALSSSLRDSPTSVIHPDGSPIIHSVKAEDNLWLPSLPSGLVGDGAGLPSVSSQRLMAGSNLPQLVFCSMSLATLLSHTCPVLPFTSLVCCEGAFVPSLATGVGINVTASAFSRF